MAEKLRNVAPTATSAAIRTAMGLRKFSGGASRRTAMTGGRTISAVSTGRASGSTAPNSRCGLPHLWQKRASGGSCAPQLQNSGMVHCSFSVTHRAEWKQPVYRNRTFTSGRLSKCVVSMKRTVAGDEVMTTVWVWAPSLEKRTPRSRLPSVTPQAAKIRWRPGASSLVV